MLVFLNNYFFPFLMRKVIILITVIALILSILVPALSIFLSPNPIQNSTVSGE